MRGEAIGLLEIVRRQQHGHALLPRELLHLVPHVGARLRVEARGRLVEEEHLRAVQKTERDVELALHAARVRAHEALLRIGEAEPLEQLLRARRHLTPRHAVQVALQLEVLDAGRLGVDAVLLADDADRLPDAERLPHDVVPGNDRAALVGLGQRRQDLHRRRLAGAIRAEQPEDRAALDREAHAVERTHPLGVRLREALGLDCELHCYLLQLA